LYRSPQNVIEINIEAVKHGISVIIVPADAVLPLTLVIDNACTAACGRSLSWAFRQQAFVVLPVEARLNPIFTQQV
jgi:hypothetical protein